MFTSEATLRGVTNTHENVSGASATTAGAAPGTGPAAVWVVVNVTGPDTVAAGAAVTVTATVTNVSGETARGVRLEVRNAAEARLVERAVYQVAELAPGGQTTVAVTGEVLARPGARLQTQLVATGGYLATWTFYAGLGRTIETQGEAEQISNVIVTGAGYDWHGVVSQTVPYVVAAAGGVYQALDWNQPQRRYEYDLLGRTTVVTNTDNSAVHTAYQYLKTAVLDELGHQTIQENDALGRLVSSKQYSGTFASPSWNAAPYATATYGYNVRDQLTGVVGADNATTTLTYDLLGRKTAMTRIWGCGPTPTIRPATC